MNQRRQRARAASHEAWTAEFSEPRSRSRCCLSAQRWPLITYGEEASTGSHFDASNIQPAAVATGSILASANALAAADSGRPARRGASLSRVPIELHQPIRLNLRRASEASRYRPMVCACSRAPIMWVHESILCVGGAAPPSQPTGCGGDYFFGASKGARAAATA